MPKSLADLRTSPHTSLPERSYSLCLAAGLVAEVQTLLDELDTLMVTTQSDDDKPTGPPKRLNDGPGPRIAAVNARLAEVWSEMDEHTGDLRLRAITDGEWRRWVDENPARPESARDDDIAYGVCNADALMLNLGRFAHSWNGEPIAEQDWAFIESKAGHADLKQIARAVVTMHEMAADLGKYRLLSLGNRGSANGSPSRSASESPPDDSTDGNPESDTSTSTPQES